ncbi:MFS transporter [Lacisediminihabitans profunda]|uniref:MFS transporter n=2 Tax=Lacisediminihabitans profunda TaxID=2594790 RepID=A0A5C8ULS6_9MICO|nr:MFS transporter [Lacisediminihabitans profunda]
MILLDNSVIFTALPSLQADLHLSATELAWVQDAYTLVFGGLLLLGARAGDLIGRKRVFIVGLIIFASASLSIALAPSAGWLIASRAVQGIGAAIVAPSALSLLTASFEGRERARAVAWYAAMAGIGASLGLVIGGALASWISWRAGFFVNVPIGIAMIALAPRYLPRIPAHPGRLDIAGAILSTLGVGGLVFATLNGSENGWTSVPTLIALGGAVVALVLLVIVESRAVQPIVPLRLFASRERTGAFLTRFFYLAAMIGFFFFTSQFLQRVLGFTALQAGLAFLPMTIVNFAVAMLVPRIIGRAGAVPVLVAGVALTLAGMIWLSRVDPDSSYLLGVALPMVLIGGGQGLAFAPMTSAGIAGTSPADAGAASGLVNTFHQVGSSLGLGILVATASAAGAAVDHASAQARLATEVSAALTAGSVLLALALAATLALIAPAARSARARVRQSNAAATVPAM